MIQLIGQAEVDIESSNGNKYTVTVNVLNKVSKEEGVVGVVTEYVSVTPAVVAGDSIEKLVAEIDKIVQAHRKDGSI